MEIDIISLKYPSNILVITYCTWDVRSTHTWSDLRGSFACKLKNIYICNMSFILYKCAVASANKECGTMLLHSHIEIIYWFLVPSTLKHVLTPQHTVLMCTYVCTLYASAVCILSFIQVLTNNVEKFNFEDMV